MQKMARRSDFLVEKKKHRNKRTSEQMNKGARKLC